MEDKLKHIIQNSLRNSQVDPPAHIWDGIEKSLHSKKRRIVPLWIKLGGIAASLVVCLWTYMVVLENNGVTNDLANYVVNDSVGESTMVEDLAIEESVVNASEEVFQQTIESEYSEEAPVLQKKIESALIPDISREIASIKLTKLNGLKATLIHVNAKPNEVKLSRIRQETNYEAIINENLKRMAENREELTFKPTFGTQYSVFNSIEKSAKNTHISQDNTNYDVSGGVNIALNSNKRFGIRTGIYYSQMNQSSRNQTSFSSSVLNDDLNFDEPLFTTGGIQEELVPHSTWGNIDISPKEGDALPVYSTDEKYTDNNFASEIQQTAGYLEVPFILKYAIVERRLGVDVLGGINTNFLINNKARLTQGDVEHYGKTSGLKSFTSNSVAGLSIYYSINDNINVTVEPKIKYYYENLSETTNVEFQPLVLGVFTGLSYNF